MERVAPCSVRSALESSSPLLLHLIFSPFLGRIRLSDYVFLRRLLPPPDDHFEFLHLFRCSSIISCLP